MFNTIPTVDFSSYVISTQKIIDLNTAAITKALETQQIAAKNLLSLSQARAKAAMEIKDIDDFSAFVTEQSEIVKSSIEEVTDSTQVAAEDAKTYFEEIQAILVENQEIAAKSASTLTPIAKKAV